MDAPYERHVFVCALGPWCKDAGGEAVQKAMKAAVKAAGLGSSVRVNKAACLNQCGHGPMAVVYPDAVWYSGLDVAAGARIAREHLVGGTPVEDLRYRAAKPGANKTPEVKAAEAAEKAAGL